MLICDSTRDAACWSTVWTGTTSVVTIVLAGAAIFAGYYNYQLLKRESDRDKRTELADRRRQAHLVASRPHTNSRNPQDPVTGLQEAQLFASVILMNASPLPVYDTIVTWFREEPAGALLELGSKRLGMLGSGDRVWEPTDAILLGVNLDPESGMRTYDSLRAEITFRDTEGRYWRRDVFGILSELEGPSHHTDM